MHMNSVLIEHAVIKVVCLDTITVRELATAWLLCQSLDRWSISARADTMQSRTSSTVIYEQYVVVL